MDKQKMMELVKKSQSGEPGAMEELLRAAYTPVSYQCRRFLKTGQDAEDVTQEILILLYEKLDTLREPEAFWGWMNQITVNCCKSAIARSPSRKEAPILEDEEGYSILDSLENEDKQLMPEDAFDNAETARMIGGIVDELPEPQRICILLYYYNEMSVKEIAETIEAPENTVKSRLNYARKAIKEKVLAYEKRQGLRLHSLAPIPLLFYFLHRDAVETTDSAAAQRVAREVMVQGAAAMGEAAGSTAAKSVAEAAGQASAYAIKGLSVKTIAAITASILAVGGAVAGIMAIVDNSAEKPAEIVAEATMETENVAGNLTEEAATEEINTQEETEVSLFNKEALATLPYNGDADKCVMTDAQAEAFAAVLDDCILESQGEEFQYEAFAENLDLGFIDREQIENQYTPFCKAALFDAGGGIPALWVTQGYEDNSTDGLVWYSTFKIYCWDGAGTVLGIDGSKAGDGDTVRNCNLTEQGLLVGCSAQNTGDGLMRNYSELYSISGGMVSEGPVHVLECFTADASLPGKTEKVKAYISGNGHAGVAYKPDTLTEDKWVKDADEFSTMVHVAAVDGEFIQSDNVFGKELNHVFWEYSGEDYTFGQGEQLYTGVNKFYWNGNWADAEKLISLLRGGAGEGPATDSTREAETESSLPDGASVSMEGNIRRTTVDSQGYDIEIFYEIPVFEGSGAGYQKISEHFQEMQDQFLDPENEEMGWVWEIVEENPPVSDSYYYTVSATINSQTEKYASVTQRFSTFLGGIRGAEYSYHNFRTDTGETLLLTDVLDGTETEIKDMVTEAFEAGNPGTGQDVLENIRSRNIEEFNFYITDGRICVCFTQYDIYGVSYGPDISIETELPAELKTEWR